MDISFPARFYISLILVVAISCIPEVAAGGATPILFARGTYYQVGEEMGRASTYRIKNVLHSKTVKDLVLFNETTRGQQLYSSLLVAAETHYPQYVDELRGLAAGAGVPFDKIFIWNIEPEINIHKAPTKPEGYAPPPPPSGGCSDFLVNNKDWALHVHSEDLSPEACYLGSIWVTEIIDENAQIIESSIGFAYPGMSPGSAWTLNSHGLMVSGNILLPRIPSPEGAVPRRIANRALLTATSANNFKERVEKLPDIGAGFNYMLSERLCANNNPDCILQLVIELVNNGTNHNMVHVHQATDFDHHFNEYQYLTVDQHPDPSSRYRQARLQQVKQQQHGPLTTFSQLTDIMSDQYIRKFPFYRDGAPPDYLATGSIAIADWFHNKLYIYKDKPTQSSPEVTFDLRPWHGRALNLQERMVDPEPFTQPSINEVHGGAPSREKKDEL